MFDDNIFLNDNLLLEEVLQNAPDQTYRREKEVGLLSRELKRQIRKSIMDWRSVEPIIGTLSAGQLVELEVFLWKEAMEHAGNALQQKMTREYITARMEPTSTYHRRQMCGEPMDACRANYCIQSNPNCASRKLREHIRVIATVFDRRSMRTPERTDALETFLRYLVTRYSLFGVILTNQDGAPILALTDMEHADGSDRSDFVRSFYRNLESIIEDQRPDTTTYFDLFVKAGSHKFVSDQTLILTILAVNEMQMNDALQEGVLGVKRITLQNRAE